MKINKLFFVCFSFFFSVANPDIVDITVLERDLCEGEQQIFFYHDKHEKTPQCDAQLELFKKIITSGEFKFLLENPIGDSEKTKLIWEIKGYLNEDAEKTFVDQGLIYLLAKEDFGSNAPIDIDTLRCPELINCLESLIAHYRCIGNRDLYFKLLYKDEPEILEEIIDEIKATLTDEKIEEWVQRWDEAREKVEKLLKKNENNRQWLEENRVGIKWLAVALKQVAELFKNFEFNSIENLKARVILYNETQEMFDTVNLSLEEAKNDKLNRHGWNNGVEFESLIEFLDERYSTKIAIVAGTNHLKRLIKILINQEFTENEDLSLEEKTKFDLLKTSTTKKESGENSA
jgi:hypothetical protein